jgi:hypothetical protein
MAGYLCIYFSIYDVALKQGGKRERVLFNIEPNVWFINNPR